MKRHSVFVWVLAITSAIGVDAAVTKLNSEMMNRDLRITEGILKDLLGNDESGPAITGGSGATRVQGAYHEGYGVLFNVDGSRVKHRLKVRVSRGVGDDEEVIAEDRVVTVKKGVVTTNRGQPVRVVVKHGVDKEDAPDLRKERITEFMTAYAGAIRQLRPEDRITVRVNSGGRSHAYVHAGHDVHEIEGLHELGELKEFGELSELKELGELVHAELKDAHVEIEAVARELATAVGEISQAVLADYSGRGTGGSGLVATILKKDLVAHQGSDKLAAKIRFEEIVEKADSGNGRDVHIFKGILQSFLSKDQVPFGKGSRPTGFYQNGIGAVFFVEHQIGSDFTWTGSDFAWVAGYDKSGAKSAKDTKGQVAALGTQISQALADYGSTLKSVGNDEQIIVNVRLRLRGRKGPDAPSRLVFKVSKDAVNRYSQGKLSLPNFMVEVMRSEM